jgi:hypothetical protein
LGTREACGVSVAGWIDRRGMREAAKLVVLPGMALLLPWRLCFPLYRWLAGHDWLYGGETRAAMAAAASQGFVQDPRDWARAYRLMRLVDHADLYLSRFRGRRWMRRHVEVRSGAWPASGGPFLAITFHWGSGLWGLRHMLQSGRPAAVLVRDIPASLFAGRPVLGWYADVRTRETARAGGGGVIYATSGSLAQIRRRFRHGGNVVALLDVPPEEGQKHLECEFLGRRAAFPRGLVHLAVSEKMPVVVYEVSLDRESGKRVLTIDDVGCVDDEKALLALLVARLETMIRRDPPSWHHWPGVAAFFSRAEMAGASAGHV